VKKAKPKTRRRRRPAVDLIAAEGSFGRRLRKLEEVLNLSSPTGKISAAFVFCRGGPMGNVVEGASVSPDGFVTGAYNLGEYREVVFFGPKGLAQEESEAIHRAAIIRLLAEHPEYLTPWPEPPMHVQLGASSEFITLEISQN
jgi:hypothetical protein